MLNDKTTLKDLSVFGGEETGSIFALLDRTTTQAGRDMLRKHITQPPATQETLQQMQDVVKYIAGREDFWPDIISNGTLVMLEKFFESADTAGSPPGSFSTMFGPAFQKLFNRNEYFFTQFSISHIADFLKGCLQLVRLLEEDELPTLLRSQLELMQDELKHRLTEDVAATNKNTPYKELAALNYKVRREMKHPIQRLLHAYAQLDAWRSMALATAAHNWTFPQLMPSDPAMFVAKQVHHPLLKAPVSYDIELEAGKNFLLLTGANMSGKTTFMRSLGVAALLAHLGCGVPAASLKLSFLHGIITNMHVEDNIMQGESYFFAEVKRMKLTAEQLLQHGPHLVLMDELFKGTNVHDAYECTRGVIEGLQNHPHHLMVLSTHLYEVAQHFSNDRPIIFKYFVTEMEQEHFHFTYELKDGISNDRIGYKILQQEGVLKLLHKKESHS